MEIILRNIMEDYVLKTLDQTIEQFNVCQCEQCRLDIASYALNRLPSKYVATTRGELMSRLYEFDKQFQTQVITELTAAAELIKGRPRH